MRSTYRRARTDAGDRLTVHHPQPQATNAVIVGVTHHECKASPTEHGGSRGGVMLDGDDLVDGSPVAGLPARIILAPRESRDVGVGPGQCRLRSRTSRRCRTPPGRGRGRSHLVVAVAVPAGQLRLGSRGGSSRSACAGWSANQQTDDPAISVNAGEDRLRHDGHDGHDDRTDPLPDQSAFRPRAEIMITVIARLLASKSLPLS